MFGKFFLFNKNELYKVYSGRQLFACVAADNAFSQPTRLPSNPFLETCEPYTGLAQMAPSGTTATPTHATALPSLHFSPGQRMQVVAGAAGGTPSVGGATPGAPDGVASRQPTQSALKQQTNPFL